MKLLSSDETLFLKTFFNPSSILRARLGSRTGLLFLKKRWFSIVSIQAQSLLTFLPPSLYTKGSLQAPGKSWGSPCSHLLCHLHTKNIRLQKRTVNQCFDGFLSGTQIKEISAYICKTICYIRLQANMLYL